MTKEELAKKRGIKISKETPSPSEALLTAKPRPQKAVRTATKKRAVKKTATPIKSPAKLDIVELRVIPIAPPFWFALLPIKLPTT